MSITGLGDIQKLVNEGSRAIELILLCCNCSNILMESTMSGQEMNSSVARGRTPLLLPSPFTDRNEVCGAAP